MRGRDVLVGVTAAVLTALHPLVASAKVIGVPPSGNLQAALSNAQPGDVIELVPGGAYVGNFTLPQKEGAQFITIRPSGGEAVAEGRRMQPGASVQLPKLRSPNSLPVIQTAPGAHHWRLQLLEFQANAVNVREIISLGEGTQTSTASVPHDLIIDRSYIHGDAAVGQRRCIALNSASTTISNSYIADCKYKGEDAQAIAGWNGPGPFAIINNYLEASGENVLFGGGDPAIANLVPSDITITANTIAKPLKWRGEGWTVKNLFELKNARRVTVRGNTFANS